MGVFWEDRAWNDYLYWQTQQRQMQKLMFVKHQNREITNICNLS